MRAKQVSWRNEQKKRDLQAGHGIHLRISNRQSLMFTYFISTLLRVHFLVFSFLAVPSYSRLVFSYPNIHNFSYSLLSFARAVTRSLSFCCFPASLLYRKRWKENFIEETLEVLHWRSQTSVTILQLRLEVVTRVDHFVRWIYSFFAFLEQVKKGRKIKIFWSVLVTSREDKKRIEEKRSINSDKVTGGIDVSWSIAWFIDWKKTKKSVFQAFSWWMSLLMWFATADWIGLGHQT